MSVRDFGRVYETVVVCSCDSFETRAVLWFVLIGFLTRCARKRCVGTVGSGLGFVGGWGSQGAYRVIWFNQDWDRCSRFPGCLSMSIRTGRRGDDVFSPMLRLIFAIQTLGPEPPG